MKQIYIIIVFALSLLTSCNKEPEYFELLAPTDKMNLTATNDNVTLDLAKAKQEAIRFTWNQATDRGQDTEISYKFRIYQNGNKSNSTGWIDLGSNTESLSYKNAELNSVLNQLGINTGDETALVAEVIADVIVSPVYMKPEISLFEFSATGYENNLYLFYTSGGSVLRVLMQAETEADGIYTWKGLLPAGVYWFSTNRNTGYPAYMKGSDAESLEYQKQEGGTAFQVPEESLIELRVDLEKMKVISVVQDAD